ncbi:MAG: 3-hydroxybutyrate dehydrogenase [Alphaproteobacteria bacterium]
MGNLQGKSAIVTGSTSGIGLGIARSLAKEGANIVLNGLGDAAAIETLRQNLAAEFGIKVSYHGADMRKASEIADMVAHSVQQHGRLDVLVNNAGVQFKARVENFPADQWDNIIAINLSSAFHATKAALPLMQQQQWGRIINIASAHGLVGSEEKAAYVASKHGILGFTKVVALENARTGVTCNSICPGWVKTPLVEKQIADIAAKENISIAAAEKHLLDEKQPTERFVLPEDIGALVVFLCSEAANNLTGTSLSVDGGWVAQ